MAADHSLSLSDTFFTKGANLDIDEEEECLVLDDELPVVSVPKTTIDLPAGCPIPPCAHLGTSNSGLHAPNILKGKCECTGCTS